MKKSEVDTSKALIDSNILFYVFDKREPEKSLVAELLVGKIAAEGRMVLSAQNLNEFYNIATSRKRASLMTHDEAVLHIEDYIATSEIYPVTQEVVLRAVEAIKRYQLSLWDSLIWAVAKLNGVTLIYTEDMPSAPEIEGVRYINPFV